MGIQKGYRFNFDTKKLERDEAEDRPDTDTSRMLGSDATPSQVLENLEVLTKNDDIIRKIHKDMDTKTKEELLKQKATIEKWAAFVSKALSKSTSEAEIKIHKFCLYHAEENLKDINKQLKSM